MTGPCGLCGRRLVIEARGWCSPCYGRWLYHGKPETFPPPRFVRDPGRLEDCLDLTRQGLSITQTAARLGVSTRHVSRLRARAREAALCR